MRLFARMRAKIGTAVVGLLLFLQALSWVLDVVGRLQTFRDILPGVFNLLSRPEVSSIIYIGGLLLIYWAWYDLKQGKPGARRHPKMELALHVIVGAIMGGLTGAGVWAWRQPATEASHVPSSPEITVEEKTAPASKPEEFKEVDRKPAVAKPKPEPQPLMALSDGQRFLLKQKLLHTGGEKSVTIVMTRAGNPQAEIVFEQLLDIFRDSGWQVSTAQIGFVSVVGANFPDETYMSGPSLSDPTLAEVYSIFLSVGLKVPITPNAYMGPTSMGALPPVVTVVR